jgi:hypothetical protein
MKFRLKEIDGLVYLEPSIKKDELEVWLREQKPSIFLKLATFVTRRRLVDFDMEVNFRLADNSKLSAKANTTRTLLINGTVEQPCSVKHWDYYG